MRLEKETANAETRIKQQELDERIAMQEKIEEQSHALSEALAVAEDANKAKTVFLSNMSHEIRTPMNAIIGLNNIALSDPDISDRTREYLEKIKTSAKGIGTTFVVTITLGLSDRNAEKAGSLHPSGGDTRALLKNRRILLAEDMQINAEIMMMMLSMHEMEVDHAENGRIAVDKYMQNPEGYYDAILMDMRMPEMNGLEASSAIRGSGRADSASIPIIALTANAFDEDVQRSLQAGLNAHLSKPVEPDILFNTLARSFVK